MADTTSIKLVNNDAKSFFSTEKDERNMTSQYNHEQKLKSKWFLSFWINQNFIIDRVHHIRSLIDLFTKQK